MHPATLVQERRQVERHPCDLRASCTPCTSGSQVQWSGQVLDISRGGLRLVLERRFEPRTLLRILLRNEAGDLLMSVLARVIHLSAHGETKWVLGCAIAPPLTEDGLQVLLDG